MIEGFAGLDPEQKRELLTLLETRAAEAASGDFLKFIHFVDPTFSEGRHHQVIAEYLEAVDRGDVKRLMVFMPPRSGKTYMISRYFTPYFLGHHPTSQILSISYKMDLAEDWAKQVRELVRSDEYRAVFPQVEISPITRGATSWMTTKGGVYVASGITGGIAGRGATLGVIDDPLNEQDAYSEAARKDVIQKYPGGFRSRLMPDGRIIILMTRWHEEDLAGWLLTEAELNPNKDQWEVLSIPALLDAEGSTVLGYREGTTYWPKQANPPDGCELSGWTTEQLALTKENLPPHQWAALYMQRPTVEGGNILKRQYWKRWKPDQPPSCNYVLISVDTAYGEKETNDYSAITVWGVFQYTDRDDKNREVVTNNMIMLGAERGRWDFFDLRDKALKKYEDYQPDALLVEKKASGQSLIQELQRQGLPVYPYQPDRDKVARAWACTPAFYQGRIWAPQKEWAEDVINECSSFPSGKFKDYVDTVTQAVLWLRDSLMITTVTEPWDDMDKSPQLGRRRKFY